MAEAEVELVLVRLEGGRTAVLKRPPAGLEGSLQKLVQGPLSTPMQQ